MFLKLLPSKLFPILLIFLPGSAWTQIIQGKVVDTENNPLEFVSVAILNPKDSMMIDFVSSNDLGAFKLSGFNPGEHIFQAHLVGYRTYQKKINFEDKIFDMGLIILENDTKLKEVVVTLVVPISIKKDTVVYNTKSFNVRNDDTVEDLLKKLPGIEVDVSGKITAHGEEVTKIYVDGKEFFHGDPAIASKNLSADYIQRVEVIDEKSEKERVTGLKDSRRKKVINLELKEDNKTNDFGKLEGGYGTDNRYLTSLNYNRFTSKLQSSLIGKYNNVNSTGSDISELMEINTGIRMGSGSRPGFLTTGIAGMNFGYELRDDKNVNVDYLYNYSDAESGNKIIQRTEFIGDLEIYSENISRNENVSNNNNLNFSYGDKSNQLSSFYINGSLYYNNNRGNGINTLNKYNGQNELDLQSVGRTTGESKNNAANMSLQYTKRLSEKSKSNISVSGNIDAYTDSNKSSNNQVNRFNVSDSDNTYQTIEEVIRNDDHQNLNAGLNLSFVEQVIESHFIEARANLLYVSIFDEVNQTAYENDILQNPLIYDQSYTNNNFEGGMFYKYDHNTITLYLGGLFTSQNQVFGLESAEEYSNRYTNFNAEMSLIYMPKMGKSMNFAIKESVVLPSLYQLTPVVNDFNSLFIYIGNPLLTPENIVSVSGIYSNYNFAKGFHNNLIIGYRHISNSIVNSEFTDQWGIRYSSFENFGDKNHINLTGSMGKSLKSLDLRYALYLEGSYSEYLSIINTQPNETQSKSGTIGLSLENNKKDKIDAIIGASWNKNYTVFSNDNNADRDYLQQSYYAKADWNITHRLNLNTHFKYDIYTDSNFGTDQSIPIWNASASYLLLKSKKLNVMLTALDILNKNVGIIRTSADNYFEETHQEILGNYYMVGLMYTLE